MARITDRQRRMREDVREKISAAKHIASIEGILMRDDITNEEVQILKLKLDAHFKMLAKVLPDMKTVELSGELNLTNHEDWLDELDD